MDTNYAILFDELDKRLEKGRVIISIEGGSASGKTTLSQILDEKYDCTVFHMDDFFLQPYQRTKERFNEVGGNIDWERFLDEVLIPLRNKSKICYRKFNCATMSLGGKIEVNPNKLIVVEGVYSLHPKLEEFYDLSIFLDISSELQKERILKRNNSVFAKRFFEEWIPLENKYFNETDIKKRSDIVIKISSR